MPACTYSQSGVEGVASVTSRKAMLVAGRLSLDASSNIFHATVAIGGSNTSTFQQERLSRALLSLRR